MRVTKRAERPPRRRAPLRAAPRWPGVALAYALLAGCALAPAESGPTTPPGPAEAARHRAALATIRVENHTDAPLTISYRTVPSGTAAVGIGVVPARATLLLAPVPAGEPITLLARDPEGRVRELAPRSLQIGEEWVWVIREGEGDDG